MSSSDWMSNKTINIEPNQIAIIFSALFLESSCSNSSFPTPRSNRTSSYPRVSFRRLSEVVNRSYSAFYSVIDPTPDSRKSFNLLEDSFRRIVPASCSSTVNRRPPCSSLRPSRTRPGTEVQRSALRLGVAESSRLLCVLRAWQPPGNCRKPGSL